jgi:hypothetical protein
MSMFVSFLFLWPASLSTEQTGERGGISRQDKGLALSGSVRAMWVRSFQQHLRNVCRCANGHTVRNGASTTVGLHVSGFVDV